MRTIKFRCWDSRNNEYVYSDDINNDGCFYINTKGVLFMYAIPKSETGLDKKYIKSYDVEQFSGLVDKSGKEIYDGDILLYTEHSGYSMPSCVMEVCRYDEYACFGYKVKGDICHDLITPFSVHDELQEDILNHCEIVGNIHEQN